MMKVVDLNALASLSKYGSQEFIHVWRNALYRQLRRLSKTPIAYFSVLIVLMIDSGLFGLHLAFRYATMDSMELPNWFNLSQEGSLGELFEYLMTGSGAICLALLAVRRRSAAIGAISGLMFYITADNSLSLHETGGVLLGAYLPSIGLLEADELGEVVTLLPFGLAMVAAIVLCIQSEAEPINAGGGIVIFLIILAAVFGVGIDVIHAALPGGNLLLEVVVSGIEDGGELICFTLAGGVSIALFAADRTVARRNFEPSN